MEGTRTAFAPSAMERIKASDVVTYVVGTMEAGKLAWPIPRSRLDGLRLKQVLDAIKMHLAQFYLDCLSGTEDLDDYRRIKSCWSWFATTLPIVFTRNEEWELVKDLESWERQQKLIMRASSWAMLPGNMNDEELELYNEPEPLPVFLDYLEKMAVTAKHPFDHVLGHLSRETIYFDATLPILNGKQ